MAEALLEATELTVRYAGRRRGLRKPEPFDALAGVSFQIEPGEAFAIVGESGAGKSTIARCVVGLQRPTSGRVAFGGRPLEPWRNRVQRRAIQMVFQDPYSSLNPRMTIGTALSELLRVNNLADGRAAVTRRATELLELVGLPPGALQRRPSAFSGGQRQRIAIARALALEPTLLVADEPVSALDVSIQASILLLLKRLQRDLGLTMLFISHDLAVVRQLCDRIVVMRDGRIVERGDVATLFADPQDPYTQQLLAATTDLPPLELPAALSGAAGAAGSRADG
jgi:ABC-type glutathione transport system ATPase component